MIFVTLAASTALMTLDMMKAGGAQAPLGHMRGDKMPSVLVWCYAVYEVAACRGSVPV